MMKKEKLIVLSKEGEKVFNSHINYDEIDKQNNFKNTGSNDDNQKKIVFNKEDFKETLFTMKMILDVGVVDIEVKSVEIEGDCVVINDFIIINTKNEVEKENLLKNIEKALI